VMLSELWLVSVMTFVSILNWNLPGYSPTACYPFVSAMTSADPDIVGPYILFTLGSSV
jgi:hypothetical protein